MISEKQDANRKKIGEIIIMKAIKRTLKIEIEVLSVDSIPALIQDMQGCFCGNGQEYLNGKLVSDDGDCITWEMAQETVEF